MTLEQKNKKIVTEYFDRYWVKGDVSVGHHLICHYTMNETIK